MVKPGVLKADVVEFFFLSSHLTILYHSLDCAVCTRNSNMHVYHHGGGGGGDEISISFNCICLPCFIYIKKKYIEAPYIDSFYTRFSEKVTLFLRMHSTLQCSNFKLTVIFFL